MNKPLDYDIHSYRSRATNVRKAPLYIGQSADQLRRTFARITGGLGFAVFVAVLVALWIKV